MCLDVTRGSGFSSSGLDNNPEDRLTPAISPIKIVEVGLPPRGSGRHDLGKNLVNDHWKARQ
jgi:hypothetical protein